MFLVWNVRSYQEMITVLMLWKNPMRIKDFDKGLKVLKEANQPTLFLKFNDRFDNPSFQPQSATPGSQRRFSLADYSPIRTLAMSEPAKKAGSK